MGLRNLTLACVLVTSACATAPRPAAPVADRDGDRIPDARDRCPDAPEDEDGWQDEDGCPDPDNDHDRIADVDDKCPNEPETYNGFEDEDGCPDHAKIEVHVCDLRIEERIYFRRGSARLGPETASLLDAIAATIQANPAILRIELAGHATSDEKDAAGLSEARARSVREALVRRGVEMARLTPRGHGAAEPIEGAHATERSRRVAFVVLERAE